MIATIINWILSLFGIDKSKDPVLKSLEKEKESLEKTLEEIENEKNSIRDIVEHFND